MEKGVQLYQQNYGEYIMISGGTVYDDVTIAQLMKAHAMKLGIPEKPTVRMRIRSFQYKNDPVFD